MNMDTRKFKSCLSPNKIILIVFVDLCIFIFGSLNNYSYLRIMKHNNSLYLSLSSLSYLDAQEG